MTSTFCRRVCPGPQVRSAYLHFLGYAEAFYQALAAKLQACSAGFSLIIEVYHTLHCMFM